MAIEAESFGACGEKMQWKKVKFLRGWQAVFSSSNRIKTANVKRCADTSVLSTDFIHRWIKFWIIRENSRQQEKPAEPVFMGGGRLRMVRGNSRKQCFTWCQGGALPLS